MKKRFIDWIEIENFKCFKNFRAEGFGRVNLIGGKNSVGKTALLEAFYLSKALNDKYHFNSGRVVDYTRLLEKIITERYSEDILNDFLEEKGVNYIRKHFFYKKIEDFDLKNTKIEVSEEKDINLYIKFKSSNKVSKSYYELLYSQIIKNELEDRLDSYLKLFDDEIEKFRIIDSEPYCKKDGEFLNINELGDGFGNFLSFVMILLVLKNGIFLIDEMENGIHYTNYEKLWEIVLTLSKENSVQVFATTHSKEFIESFARVAKELEDRETKFIKLTKIKSGDIIAGIKDYEVLEYALEDGHEVR